MRSKRIAFHWNAHYIAIHIGHYQYTICSWYVCGGFQQYYKYLSEHRDITTKGRRSLWKKSPLLNNRGTNNWGTNNRGNGLFTSIIPINLKLITLRNDTLTMMWGVFSDAATVACLLGMRWQHWEAECANHLTLKCLKIFRNLRMHHFIKTLWKLIRLRR